MGGASMPRSPCQSGLLADLYELTMAAAYFEGNFSANATFELFVRSLPSGRSFLIAAGLEQVLEYLENLQFGEEEIDYLRRQPVFEHISDTFFEYLSRLRFTGEVWAIPEGTAVFRDEPILRVTAPIIEAQIVETFLLSMLTFQTLVATKGARVVMAAQGKSIVEFGSRRAHGPEAGVLAGRAAYIGGCVGTSNVEAGHRYGIPVFGTLAHSFVMAYEQEAEAFRQFSQLFPGREVLLVDTYDTLAAVDKIIHAKLHPTAVRLDSGNLLSLSKHVRRRLDEAGLRETQIFASGDLDEFIIQKLVTDGAPIDAFGVGTALATSLDAPALGGVYKLVDVESQAGISYRAKFSEEKITYPGRKQVFRFRRPDGMYQGDMIGCEEENFTEAESLLHCVMRDGVREGHTPLLPEIRERARHELEHLPRNCVRLDNSIAYPVSFTRKLEALLRVVRRRVESSDSRAFDTRRYT
jgi:nicotinate phosphoribosyltransferase